MNVKQELMRLTTRELVAYFNILRTPCLKADAAGADHLPIVRELLHRAGLVKVVTIAERKNKPISAMAVKCETGIEL